MVDKACYCCIFMATIYEQNRFHHVIFFLYDHTFHKLVWLLSFMICSNRFHIWRQTTPKINSKPSKYYPGTFEGSMQDLRAVSMVIYFILWIRLPKSREEKSTRRRKSIATRNLPECMIPEK